MTDDFTASPLQLCSVEELIEELERRASGLALFVVVSSDRAANEVKVFDRVKGDPFAVIGYAASLHGTAKIHFEKTVGKPL